MTLSHALTPDLDFSPRYAVYIFYKENTRGRLPYWEKIKETGTFERAQKYAKALQRKNKYARVEVKKWFFCEQQNRIIGRTVRVYDEASVSWRDIFRALDGSITGAKKQS